MKTVARLLGLLSGIGILSIGTTNNKVTEKRYNDYNYYPGYYDYYDIYGMDRIAVANRGKGDVLLIESESEESQILIQLNKDSEPMYVSNSFLTNEFYIGDRANAQFYIYDTITLQRIGIISGCNGIFHQYYNLLNQLWIVCDQDLSILVIDTATKKPIITIEIDHIQDTGFQPHDITANEQYAFVSLLKMGATNGFIIQYSTKTFDEINRLEVGGDPHLFLDPFQRFPRHIFVSSQAVGEVYKINIDSLIVEDTLNVHGAHGIWGNLAYLYVTDITSTGSDAVYVIDVNEFVISSTFDSIVPAAHNCMVNCELDKLFITHTLEDKVSMYDIGSDGMLENQRIIFEEEGSSPFGVMCVFSNQYHGRYDEYYNNYIYAGNRNKKDKKGSHRAPFNK